MKKYYLNLKPWLILVLSSLFISISHAAIKEDRAAVDKLKKQGNWKEALVLATKNFNTVSDEHSHKDLSLIHECSNRLRLYNNVEDYLKTVEEKHANNSDVLRQAGVCLQSIPHDGTFMDNAFNRGGNRHGGRGNRGEYANSYDQDRVRVIQYMQRAYEKAIDKGQKTRALNGWITAMLTDRTYNQSWKLQLLTDLTALPEIERGYRQHSQTRGAPATAEGDPIFYTVPASFDAATNDGERWRWLLAEMIKVDPKQKSTIQKRLALFLQQQLSVRTLQSYSWFFRMSANSDSNKGILQLHTLSDDETIARLANGIKRFKLPADQNFIAMYHNLYKNGDYQAGELLVEIYLDRRHYTKAAALMKDIIAKHGDNIRNHRKNKLSQIVDDWGKFEHSTPFSLNATKQLSITYRNAQSVTLNIQQIDIQKLSDDVWAYIQSNPAQLKWNKLNWTNLLDPVVNGNKKQYLGKVIASKNYPLSPRTGHWDTRASLKLPSIEKAGSYLISAELPNGKKFYTLIWVDDLMLISKQVNGATLYYLTDAETGTPVKGAELIFRGYKNERLKKPKLLRKFNTINKTFTKTTDANGQLLLENQDRNFQWMIEARAGDRRAWMGARNIWSWNRDKHQTYTQRKAFGITSQPVYKPGQNVEGKFWVRNAKYDLDQKTSTFAGREFRIEIRDPRGQKLGKPITVVADDFGGVAYSVELEAAAKLGAYQVQLRDSNNHYIGNHNFRVEKYKKPEFEVIVDAPTEPVKLGDAFNAKVTAKYYHGAPVTNAKVKLKVLRHTHSANWFPYSPWDWLYGSGYGWLDIERPWYPGWRNWGCKCPTPPWFHRNFEQPELVLEQDITIGADGTLEVKVDSALAKLAHGNQDHRYEIQVEVTDASRRTIFGNGSVLAARKPFKVTTWFSRGYALTDQRITANIAANTLDGKKVTGTGIAKLLKISTDKKGKLSEQEITQWDIKTNPNNEFTPIDFNLKSAGQYRFVSLVKDAKGREIEGAILFTVRGPEKEDAIAGDVRYNDLELIPDLRTYKPGENVKLLINTKRANSTVLLFIRGSKERKVIHISGKSKIVEIPVTLADMPNFFVEAITISDAELHQQVREIIAPPAKRVLNVAVIPNSNKYKPGEKGNVKIRVTDENGKPVEGDCVLAIYDKALEYISGGSNVAEIKSFFWKWKRHHSRTYFAKSIQACGGTIVRKGKKQMQFLGAFGQLLGLQTEIGNDDAFAVAEGVDAEAMPMAGDIAKRSRSKMKSSAPPAPMMNAAAQDAAQDQPGAAAPAVTIRKDFADLIKWQGSVKLNKDGTAEVPVDYPDNLTTWKIQTWAMAHGTRVGQASTEVITSKDLIIRLQAPRFFTEKDEVVLSAVVHNYHVNAQDAKVSLELEGGTLTHLNGDLTQAVKLEANNGEQRINWTVKASAVGNATVRMKVITADDSDAMEMTFPVHVHGIAKQIAWSREIAPDANSTQIEIDIPAERRPGDSRLEVRYSPTIAGAIVDALPYLANFPHGCTEQTLNRFVPAVITQKLLLEMGVDLAAVRNQRVNLNPQELGDDVERKKQWKRWQNNPVFNKKEIDQMVAKGVQKLTDMQCSDGGWGWFSGYGERSYPHTTAVVVHGLTQALINGEDIPKASLLRGVQWLKQYEQSQIEAIRNYQKDPKKRPLNSKPYATATDALVRLVLAENDVFNEPMLDFQFRDKNHLSLYAKSLLGLSLHHAKNEKRRDEVIRNIEQFLKYDDENQTAFLEMGNTGYWWYWYGSEIEAHAFYLKLLSAAKPKSKQARGLVKYLVNNRKHATYWNSTRDTAYCIEAIADFMRASGEEDPETEVEVLVDGKSYKKVKINRDNLFSFDNKMTLSGDILTTGKHTVEIRKTGKTPLYTNAYLNIFTKEDNIKKTGLEVKIERRYYKLVPKNATTNVAGDHGQTVKQKTDKFERIPLKTGDVLNSGDIIEVELLMESKNDYEYLLFSDHKAAGTEAESVRSGYVNTGSMHAYMEVHDEKVSFYVRQLNRGKHSLTYKLRAEIPGKFSALPAMADAMYAPELKANSDEMKLQIKDAE